MTQNCLDELTFENLFKSHFSDLMRYVNSYVQDQEAARDIVHDVYLMIWKNRKVLDISRPAQPYLYTLAQNLSLNFLKHKRVVQSHQPNVVNAYEEMAVKMERYDGRMSRLQSKLAELPEKQREVINKCVIEGKKYKETADELGITVNTVKTHITRAMKFLRDELQEDVVMLLLMTKISKS